MSAPNAPLLLRENLHLPCPDGFAMPAYLVRPQEGQSLPTLLMIYEAFGPTAEMKRIADEFAQAGYGVLMPDIFSRGNRLQCLRALMRDLKRESGPRVDDLLALRHWLVAQSWSAGERVGVMGFCMGGGFALLLAKKGLFRVAAPFYGQVPLSMEGACPLVASYGERDKITLAHGQRLETEIARWRIPADFKRYPGVGHSFMNEAPDSFLGFLKFIGPHLPSRSAYAPDAAVDARARVLAFLKTHL